jgi:hypothetical protein
MINTFAIPLPPQDIITQGFIEFTKTERANLSLCFASQILLDIHHVMRHNALSAFGDLRISGLRIQKTIDDYLKLSKTHSHPNYGQEKATRRFEI